MLYINEFVIKKLVTNVSRKKLVLIKNFNFI